MFKKVVFLAPLLGFIVFASGCCSMQSCGPGISCDPGCDMAGDCGGGCDESCEQSCGPCATTCSPATCCFPNPLHWVGGLFRRACCCDSGCGELYWGGWQNYPPTRDPCDRCGHWVGDEGYGCYEGCGGGDCSSSAGCSDCMSSNEIPRDAEYVSRAERRVSSASNPVPNRMPTKALPRTVKKSPQARRPYYGRPRR